MKTFFLGCQALNVVEMPKFFEALLGLMMSVMIVAMTAMTTWLFKLDDRQFELQSNVVTRQELRLELNKMQSNIDLRLQNIEDMVKELVDRERNRLEDGKR